MPPFFLAKANMADKKPIEKIIEEIFDDNLNPYRKIMERIWFRNILYYLGEQWIDWIISLNAFKRKPIHPFIPTPVSNIIRDYAKSMKALILNKEFAVRVWPNSNEQKDREAAMAGENLLNWMDADNDEEFEDEKEKTTLWTVLTGTAFMRTFPMKDGGVHGIDSKGNLIKTGEVVSENVMCFNVMVDNLGDNLRSKKYVGIKSLKPKEWVEDTFKKKVKTSGDDPNIVNYQSRLMKMVSEVSPWKGSGLQSQILNLKEEDLVIFKEVEFKPTHSYPKGRYVISCGDDILLDSKSLPIPVEKDKWYYSLTDFHYNLVPGRFWSDAGVNDLISPQNEINSIDQDLSINRKGLGQPYVLSPENVNVKRVDSWGNVLKVIQYDANASGGKEPTIEAGTSLPNQFLEARSINKEVAQDSAGDPKHILRGQSPTSKASGIMVDLLTEAAESSHTPDIKRHYRSMKRVYKKRLILAKHLYTEQRMIKIAGKGSDIRVMAFKASDLRNNTDVRLELDSGASSTKAGQTQMITNLVQTGMFGDLTQDPDTKQEILRRLGLGGFKSKTSVDVERAEEENMRILSAKEKDTGEKIEGIFLADINPETGEQEVLNEDPFFKFDDHAIHYEVHRRFILSKEFKTIPMKSQTVMIAHNDIHHQLMMDEIQKQMEFQLLMEGKGQPQKESTGEGA